MIPKVIHYCWFGRGELPPLALTCIESWRRFLPDYDIKLWNEDNFDMSINTYVREAYEAKKYAFVSDYARFWILYNYGGIYFDTDVEIIKPLEAIIKKGSFLGCERIAKNSKFKAAVAPGLGMGAVPQLPVFEKILSLYDTLHFINPNGTFNYTTIVQYTTSILLEFGLKDINEVQECAGLQIYPYEYFCPIEYDTGNIYISDKTYTIHHYAASWHSNRSKLIQYVKRLFGVKIFNLIVSIKKFFKNN